MPEGDLPSPPFDKRVAVKSIEYTMRFHTNTMNYTHVIIEVLTRIRLNIKNIKPI